MTEDEMVGWHHRLNGHEFEQAPGDDEGQGSLVCYSPWCHKEQGVTESPNNYSNNITLQFLLLLANFLIISLVIFEEDIR